MILILDLLLLRRRGWLVHIKVGIISSKDDRDRFLIGGRRNNHLLRWVGSKNLRYGSSIGKDLVVNERFILFYWIIY